MFFFIALTVTKDEPVRWKFIASFISSGGRLARCLLILFRFILQCGHLWEAKRCALNESRCQLVTWKTQLFVSLRHHVDKLFVVA